LLLVVVVVAGFAVVDVVGAVVGVSTVVDDVGPSTLVSLTVFTTIGPESVGGWCALSARPLASAATVANTVETTTPATVRAANGALRSPDRSSSAGGPSSNRSCGSDMRARPPDSPSLGCHYSGRRISALTYHVTVRDHVGVQEPEIRLTAWVRGRVQGVGFRWWTRARALRLGLRGYASNLDDGRVEVVAEGPRADCARLLEALRSADPPGRVDSVVERWTPAKGNQTGFSER
jgi:acylphosphatase